MKQVKESTRNRKFHVIILAERLVSIDEVNGIVFIEEWNALSKFVCLERVGALALVEVVLSNTIHAVVVTF